MGPGFQLGKKNSELLFRHGVSWPVGSRTERAAKIADVGYFYIDFLKPLQGIFLLPINNAWYYDRRLYRKCQMNIIFSLIYQ